MRELTLKELDIVAGGKDSNGGRLGAITMLDWAFDKGQQIGNTIYNNSPTVRNTANHMIETFDKVITEIRNDPRPDISRREAIDRMRNMKWGNPDGSEYDEKNRSGTNYD